MELISDNSKEQEIISFLEKYGIGKSHRKVRDLLEMKDVTLQAYQANIIISHCCKVISSNFVE